MGESSQTSQPFTYVSDGTAVDGSIRTEGRLRVDGTVRGSVHVDGILELAPSGRIEEGPVHAERMVLLGEVYADLVCQGLVEIMNGAVVQGRIQASRLDVEEGARFVGESAPFEDVPAALDDAAIAEPSETGVSHGA